MADGEITREDVRELQAIEEIKRLRVALTMAMDGLRAAQGGLERVEAGDPRFNAGERAALLADYIRDVQERLKTGDATQLA